jgi:hypothetical protein
VNKPTMSEELQEAMQDAIDENGVCEDLLSEDMRKEYEKYCADLEESLQEYLDDWDDAAAEQFEK